LDGQVLSVIIGGLGMVLNGLILFLFTDLKKDIRGLRNDQSAQGKAVEVLRTEVGFMKIIDALRAEIASLKDQLKTERQS
jgi:hypothetical protein